MQYKDYYQIMGLHPDASTKEIKQAYRKLAHVYHPDVSKATNAEERFKELSEAYKVLKNPKTRAVYDLLQDRLYAEWKASQEYRAPSVQQKVTEIPIALWLVILFIILSVGIYFEAIQRNCSFHIINDVFVLLFLNMLCIKNP